MKTGITLAILRQDGKTPVEKDKLMRCEIGIAISCFRRDRIRPGTLFGPDDLDRSNEDKVFTTSIGSVGARKKEERLEGGKKLEKCL